jgi:hypoxanthine phosphoribosyltransferase
VETVTQLYSADQITERVDSLAAEIAAKVSGHLTVIGVLKGSFVFLADLVRALDNAGLPCQVEFLRLSSYGNKQKASGDVVLIGGYPNVDDDRTVLLVDDIVDTGNSLHYAVNLLKAAGRDQILTCTLLDKPSRREADINVDFVGFAMPDEFVVGYGIDYAEDYRSLPYLGIVEKEEG